MNTFVSMMLAMTAFVLFLFKFKHSLIRRLAALFAIEAILFFYGTKTALIHPVFLWMLFEVYVRGLKVSFRQVLIAGVAFSVLVFGIFYVTLPSHLSKAEMRLSGLVSFIAGYSDYTRNAVMLLEYQKEPSYGRLLVEDNLYARIPRALMPDKPIDYGRLALSKRFYPESFAAGGAPSFGIGMYFADFGRYAIPLLVVLYGIGGVLLKISVTRLKAYGSAGDFIMVAFLSGITFLPLGVGFLLPEHALLALMIALIGRRHGLARQSGPE